MQARIEIPADAVADLCRRWKVAELSLFGSVLRDDFRPDSDIDLLVTFLPDERWSLLDLAAMQEEFAELLGRQVHLVEEKTLENPFRRRAILAAKEPVYAA